MSERSDVPCGSCSACCRGNNLVMLIPSEGDVVTSYAHELVSLAGAMRPVLKRDPNGDCIYLVAGQCSIYERAPVVCRVFDCRRWYKLHSRADRRRMTHRGGTEAEMIEAGRERLATLKEPGTEAPGKSG